MIVFSVQANTLQLVEEAIESSFSRIRFGSEFCMYAIPSIDQLREAYALSKDNGKDFSYITPRVSDTSLKKIETHLQYLNDEGGCEIVVNDLGTIHQIVGLNNLKIHLGRQLVYTPSRCPWEEITENPVSFFTKRKVKKIFYQTALNYQPTINFYKGLGAIGSDIDWIPELFSSLKFIIKNGLKISVHLYAIPVAITRKCHTARYLGEENLEKCSRPCYNHAYNIKNETLGTRLYLHGNTVFRIIEPDRRSIKKLDRLGVSDVVVTMNPLTKLETVKDLEEAINQLN
jgi:hypothetical protein